VLVIVCHIIFRRITNLWKQAVIELEIVEVEVEVENNKQMHECMHS